MNKEKQKQPAIGIHLQNTRENKRSQSSEYKHIQNYPQAVYTESIEQSKQKINNHSAHLNLQFY